MPKQIGQDAESIIDQTAAQKKATASNFNWNGLSPLGYFDQIMNMKQSQNAGNAVSSPQIPMPQNTFSQSVKPSAINTGLQQKAQMDAQNRIPLPTVSNGERPLNMQLDTPAGTGMNLNPEDYQNLAGKSALDILSMYMPRAEIDARFPMGVSEEDAMAYLWDNYSWLFPEQTGLMDGGAGTGGGSGYGLENYIPMPYDGSWGGGGYGNSQDYLRDSGLINWRI